MNKGNFEFTCHNTAKVSVKWEKFCHNTSAPNDYAVIFLPGVALDTDSVSVRQTALEYAKTSGLNTYAVYTRVEELCFINTQRYQAMAILELLKELGIKKLVLVGNSQGANRALYLNHILLGEEEISVEGLILSNPAGLYPQDPLGLIFRFFIDGLILAPIVLSFGQIGKKIKIRQHEFINALRLLTDVTIGLLKELKKSGKKIASRMRREAIEASNEFEYFEDSEVPMIIIFGEKDLPFNYEKFGGVTKLLSNSGKILLAKRISTHGLHYFRIEQVAKISWYLVNKIGNNLKTKQAHKKIYSVN